MKLSLCLTNYNRYEMLLESFEGVVNDDRISEIVIVDDYSDKDIFDKVAAGVAPVEKIKLYRNVTNLGMSRNKAESISKASNEWCILFDSDNILNIDYLDAIPQNLNSNSFYLPSFAKPQFDYRKFSGLTIDRFNVNKYLDKPMFEQCLNTCNMLVNRDAYLSTYEYSPLIKETDTLYMNYLFLKSGGQLHIVEGMEYFHRVHPQSGWLQNAGYNIRKGEELKKLINIL